jgi:uncharacterized protein YukE
MLDAFKTLFESGMISEEVKSDIEKAWNTQLQEQRDIVAAELREEFAQRYEHDRGVMVEALDKMVTNRLQAELREFAEDRKSAKEAKSKAEEKMKKDSKKMESFVIQALAKELKEFHSERQKVSENFGKLEAFVVEALATEISEFATDKKDLVDTKVRLVREAKTKFEDIKKRFIERSAKIVENTVKDTITKELSQLKEDINIARQNNFGRKLFEAFSNEFQTSYLNANSETARLLKIVDKHAKELAETQRIAEERGQLVESLTRKVKVSQELAERSKTMQELLHPLTGDKRAVMESLLETVQTSKLTESFDKYLPAVMEGKAQIKASKQALNESKAEVTGDKQARKTAVAEDPSSIDNLIDIRKLAGLKN